MLFGWVTLADSEDHLQEINTDVGQMQNFLGTH
jgi:hypothetical protein